MRRRPPPLLSTPLPPLPLSAQLLGKNNQPMGTCRWASTRGSHPRQHLSGHVTHKGAFDCSLWHPFDHTRLRWGTGAVCGPSCLPAGWHRAGAEQCSCSADNCGQSVPGCGALQDAAPALLLSLPLAFLCFFSLHDPAARTEKWVFFTCLRLDFRDTFCPPLPWRCHSGPFASWIPLGAWFAPVLQGLCSSCPHLGTPSHQWGH